MQDNLIEAFNIGIDAATDAEMIVFVNGFEHHLEKNSVANFVLIFVTKFNYKCYHFSIGSIINTYVKGLDQFVLNWVRKRAYQTLKFRCDLSW